MHTNRDELSQSTILQIKTNLLHCKSLIRKQTKALAQPNVVHGKLALHQLRPKPDTFSGPDSLWLVRSLSMHTDVQLANQEATDKISTIVANIAYC